MKAIMISTRPQWVEKILNGIKKDEVRKGTTLYKAINKLIAEQGVAPMLIYCTHGRHLLDLRKEDTKDNYRLTNQNKSNNVRWSYPPIINGKVVARFNATADLLELRMVEGGLYFTRAEYECENCYDPKLNDFHENAQMDNFELLRYTGYKLGTQISDIHINDLKIFDEPKELSEFRYVVCPKINCEYCKYNKTVEGDLYCTRKALTKAPQSYMFIEV